MGNTNPPPLPKVTWWQRNWKWVIIVSSLTFFVCLCGGIIWLTMGIMKSTDVYKMAMIRVNESDKVAEELGYPIKEGFFITGNINTSGSSGNANIQFPVSGSRNSGDVLVSAFKNKGEWQLNMLIVAIDGQETAIDLSGQSEIVKVVESETVK